MTRAMIAVVLLVVCGAICLSSSDPQSARYRRISFGIAIGRTLEIIDRVVS